MQIDIKHNVGDKIKRLRECFATTSCAGSSEDDIAKEIRNFVNKEMEK